MAPAIPYLIATTTVLSTVNALKGIKEEKRALVKKAEFDTNIAMAKGTRESYEARKAGDLVKSSAQARIAVSGGMDAGGAGTIADIEEKTAYNVGARFWEGKKDAETIQTNLKSNLKALKKKKTATMLKGVASTLMAFSPTPAGNTGDVVGYGGEAMSGIPQANQRLTSMYGK